MHIYIKGCVPQFEKWLQDNLTVVAGIFIGIALLQVRSDGKFFTIKSLSFHFFHPFIVENCSFADLWHLLSAESRERHRSRERELVSGERVGHLTRFVLTSMF